MLSKIEALKEELRKLTAGHVAGTVPDDQYQNSKTQLEQQLLALVMQSSPQAAPKHTTDLESKTSFGLIASLFLSILLIAVLGYAWKGSPLQASAGPPGMAQVGDTQTEEQKSRAAQIGAMIERLDQITQENPKDPQAWTMLGRANSVIGQHSKALAAFEKALALSKTDPDLMADYADSLAMNNNQSLKGEPMVWIERALKLDPKNIKALAMAGSNAFDQKDYASAVKYWSKVVQIGPADNRMVQMVSNSLDEARQLAGLPAVKPAPSTAAAQGQTAQSGKTLSGTVMLAAHLQHQVRPDDTLFIFARAAEGPRMPLAILRKQVKDLPFNFTLDDSTAMSPANKLSGASRVIVSARISRTGEAMPQSGDLTGETPPLAPGASGLRVEINQQVKP